MMVVVWNRKTPSSPGEDVMTMTIDFLRARLLSERSASKAAKEKIQELGKKVGLKGNWFTESASLMVHLSRTC